MKKILSSKQYASKKHGYLLNTSIFNIPGYSLIHHGKIYSQHSGLIIYLCDEFSFTIMNIEINSDLWDGQFVEVMEETLMGNSRWGLFTDRHDLIITTQHWRNFYPN